MINDEGLKLTKESEGLRLKAYKDGAGILTIGYGHTSDSMLTVAEGMQITQEQADALLIHDLGEAEKILQKEFPGWQSLTANQYAALVDFIFNRGSLTTVVGGRRADITLLKYLKMGDYEAAAKEFGRWVYDVKHVAEPGLVVRRARETQLFNS